ncbi:hypothetical protein LSO58_06630 [Acinetobacter ursingii]|uniref:Uncharacterized protein n=1 Tax=Acinetobacter ursingii TaxID=108980 RepID=A0AA46S9L4_9GAMM|nr:hypothetical protein [Acinetobacter ursingii]UYF76545.1 hypothetical protein LSO58_06630 [Acinetobacter ursingii]
MKQKPIQSQTTSILYQQPNAGEQRPSRWKTIFINTKDFCFFALLSFVLWAIIHLCYIAVGG